jgi:hypothetical protein
MNVVYSCWPSASNFQNFFSIHFLAPQYPVKIQIKLEKFVFTVGQNNYDNKITNFAKICFDLFILFHNSSTRWMSCFGHKFCSDSYPIGELHFAWSLTTKVASVDFRTMQFFLVAMMQISAGIRFQSRVTSKHFMF